MAPFLKKILYLPGVMLIPVAMLPLPWSVRVAWYWTLGRLVRFTIGLLPQTYSMLADDGRRYGMGKKRAGQAQSIMAMELVVTELERRQTPTTQVREASREDLRGREISGKTLGVVGIGHVGTRVARLAQAFGMTVLAYDPYVDAEVTARRGARSVTLDELLSQSDIVSIHCPRTSETLGMIDARAFARMTAARAARSAAKSLPIGWSSICIVQ